LSFTLSLLLLLKCSERNAGLLLTLLHDSFRR
jgi:hypothetical protein